MQRSRRNFGGSRLEESSEAEDDGSRGSGLDESGDGRNTDERGRGRGRGIKSSWRGGKLGGDGGRKGETGGADDNGDEVELAQDEGEASEKGKGNLVDVALGSTARSSLDGLDRDEPPDDLAVEIGPDEDPPSIQQFRKLPMTARFDQSPLFLQQETAAEVISERPPPAESVVSSNLPTVSLAVVEPPRHDSFWASLYLISLAALFSSFFLVYLHTSTPSLKHPLGDSIYTTLHASYHLLAVDTLVAVIVSLLWLAMLRSYVRNLVYAILVAVPVILVSFCLYPLISSFRGPWHGASLQDRAMRWFSLIPGGLAVLWIYLVYQGRYSLGKAIGILEFSCKILDANPGLLAVGFIALAGVVTWTWIWTTLFARVFLGGHLSNGGNFFILDASTWWLGIFFILVYLWTLSIGGGVQRATTAATVSQWYFHRLSVPAPTSRQVILAALNHSLTTLFGTICLSTLLTLLIRLPFLILPRRIIALVGVCTYSLLPSPVLTLTDPLTLTYSAIHSQPLSVSSRALSRLGFLFAAPSTATIRHRHNNNNPTTTSPFHSRTSSSSPLPYHLSLLLLRATRFITSLAMGFGAWVNTARRLLIVPLDGNTATSPSAPATGMRGSLYAYVVGLLAAAIGWAVLGAMDGVLTGVVDAAVVCWASEVSRGEEVKYCREAGDLFGDGNGNGNAGVGGGWRDGDGDDDGDEERRGFLR